MSDEGLQKLLLYISVGGREDPLGWKEAIIILVRKPGKDASSPVNYRPIALTSHACKLMECVVNKRLMHFLEEKGMLAS